MKPIDEQSPKLPKGRFNALADLAQRRAVPIYWRAYDQNVLKGRMHRYERAAIKRAFKLIFQFVDTSEPHVQQERAAGIAFYLTYRVCTSRCLQQQQFPATQPNSTPTRLPHLD